MSSTDGNPNNSGDAAASNGGGTSHRKLKGAAEVVHGIGENIRGRVLGAVDSSTSSDAAHPEVEHGSREIEHGLAKLTGGPGAATDGAGRSASPSSRSAAPTAPSGRGGAAPGPANALTAGFNAGPDTALAEAPYQPSGAGSEGAAHFQGGKNDRDFHPGGAQAGGAPAPDRSTLSGDPQRLG